MTTRSTARQPILTRFLPSADSGLRQALPDAAVPFALWHATLFGLAAFTDAYLVPISTTAHARASGLAAFWTPWDHFDAFYYLDIADRGYSTTSGDEWAFYPLYPALVRVLGYLGGGSHTAHLIVGLVVANLAGVAAAVLLHRTVRADWGLGVARRTSIYFAVAPLGFYLSAPYAESLFVLLAVATLLLTRDRRWIAAGVVAALAAATRPPGVMLTLVLVAEFVCVVLAARRGGSRPPLLRPLAGILIAPTGLLAFMAYGWLRTGDVLVTFHVNAHRWHRELNWPWVAIGRAVRDAEWGDPGNYLFGPLNLAVLVVCLLAVVLMVRRFPPTYTVFTAALIALPVASGQLQAVGRAALPIVTVLVLLATLTRSRTSTAHQMVIAISAGLCSVFLTMFVLLVPAIA
ncbi:mannosyltransferase family protein [Williamsia sp. SKLECPSW1]